MNYIGKFFPFYIKSCEEWEILQVETQPSNYGTFKASNGGLYTLSRIDNCFFDTKEEAEEWIKTQPKIQEENLDHDLEYNHELGTSQGAYAEDAGIYGWDLD